MIIMAQNMGLIETSARLISKKPPEKEIIHSGHFMVSNFEADADDSEDIIFTSGSGKRESSLSASGTICSNLFVNSGSQSLVPRTKSAQNISIETSLTKLFKCMSLAYRQKLTSPKWNRFKGIRLRWKDKIRLNNVIWRCWHMQFINKKNALVCQFASPLDVDTHNKPEAIVLEGKYWKRKLHAVTAEYKKWRLFSRNRLLGSKDGQDPQDMLSELEMLEWQPHSDDGHMMVDEDYMEFMTDTLFSTITANQPFAFPDTREIARGAGLADFIQPSLVQLQPNLDDFMDTLEPLQELLYSKLPPVPEEPQAPSESLYRSIAPTPAPPPSQYSFPSYSPVPSSPKPRQQVGPGYYVPSYQQLSPPPRQRTTPSSSPPHQEYVLPHTVVYRAPQQAQTMRSNSLPLGSTLNMKREEDVFAVPKLKGFGRSRSGSCLSAPSKPPPLVSANSEPQLGVTPTSSSALLAHLLTNNSGAGYSGGQVSSYSSGQALKMSGSLPSLDSYYKQPEKTQHRSVIYSTHSDNGSLNLTATASRPSVNSRLPQCQSYEPTFSFTVGDSRKLQHTSSSNLLMSSQSSSSQAVDSAGSSPKGSDSPGGTSECLSLSPLSVTSPQSPSGTVTVYKEQRRVSHINAEQKRRCNIKNGFDTLHSLIPQLSQNPNAKLSKAAMLQKGAEYIRQLRNDRQALKDEIDSLKHQVDSLNSAISNCQSLLPATGAPVSRQRTTKMREMYDEYVRVRTQENWKFWILSLLCEPLLTSFNAQVSTHSLDDLYRSTLTWVEQHCTLTVLRPLVLNALRQLCTTTEILSDPARLPAEARAAANQGSSRHGHS